MQKVLVEAAFKIVRPALGTFCLNNLHVCAVSRETTEKFFSMVGRASLFLTHGNSTVLIF